MNIINTCVHCGAHDVVEGTIFIKDVVHDAHCKWINKKWWQFWIEENYR